MKGTNKSLAFEVSFRYPASISGVQQGKYNPEGCR